MAKITPKYVRALNFAMAMFEQAKKDEPDTKKLRQIQGHYNSLRQLRLRVMYAISSKEFMFDSVINADYHHGERSDKHGQAESRN